MVVYDFCSRRCSMGLAFYADFVWVYVSVLGGIGRSV
jgi:hypothetical protein